MAKKVTTQKPANPANDDDKTGAEIGNGIAEVLKEQFAPRDEAISTLTKRVDVMENRPLLPSSVAQALLRGLRDGLK